MRQALIEFGTIVSRRLLVNDDWSDMNGSGGGQSATGADG